MYNKQNDLLKFNPNDFANTNHTIFGLPHSQKDAYIHILPVTWEVTASYAARTAKAPAQICEASFQVELFDESYPDAWKRGYFFLPVNQQLESMNIEMRKKAQSLINALALGEDITLDKKLINDLIMINKSCRKMNHFVYHQTKQTLAQGKKMVVLGGDHSTPFGHIKAIAEQTSSFGMLVIDAHLDMRKQYEHFIYSHASIMYNLLETIPTIEKMVLVGIRDYCEQEKVYAEEQSQRINVFYNKGIKQDLFNGTSWSKIVDDIVNTLSDKLYISVDIDGLMPQFCPLTGTPVYGGIDVDQLFYLFERITNAKKTIIGADLCEVGYNDNQWDANVGARVLYKLCNLIG